MVGNKSKRILLMVAVLIVVVLLLCVGTFSGTVYAYDANTYPKVQTSVENNLKTSGSTNVIIVLDEPVAGTQSTLSAASKQSASGTMSGTISGVNHAKSSIRSSASSSIQSESTNVEPSTYDAMPDISETELGDVSGFKKDLDLGIINGYSGTLTREGLEELKRNNANVIVYEDRYLQLQASESVTSESKAYDSKDGMDASIQSSLSLSTAAINANYSHNILNITGRNIRVAIIDTGIDYNHPDLGGCFGYGTNDSCKVYDGIDMYYGNPTPMDDFYHGTHVAGIISANGSSIGVAPNARLYALKVCNNQGKDCGPESRIINAIDKAVNEYHVQVINIAIGLPGGAPFWTNGSKELLGNIGKDPCSTAVDNAVNAGVVVVISAGNNANNIPGVSTINIPGAAELAITAGAVDDHNSVPVADDTLWSASARGPGMFGRLKPDIVAPGVNIESTNLGGGNRTLTGTSMATAFITGAVALLLEQSANLNLNLTPEQVRTILTQSTTNVPGKLFERGAGEVDLRAALTNNVYADIQHIDSYGRNVVNGRWEFVVTPYTTEYANITLVNYNNYNVTFNTAVDLLENMENNITLNASQLWIPSVINVENNSNRTIQINFTLSNFSDTYATTYGGIMLLNGLGYNGTDTITKMLRIPVVITVPIMNHAQLTRTMYNPSPDYDFDTYQYCYYNANTKNVTIGINWTSGSEELDLFVYNSTGGILANSAEHYNSESIYNINRDAFKWIRVDGWWFSSPMFFNIHIADTGNHAPVFQSISAIGGDINGTNTLRFYRPNNLTINVSYYDQDNDTVHVSVNDSGFVLVENHQNNSAGYAIFKKPYSDNLSWSNKILLSFTDDYEGVSSQIANILVRSSTILIDDYSPVNYTIHVRKNASLDFNISAREANNQSLNYTWYVNSSINSTTQNYSFNTSNYPDTHYVLSVLIKNNATNQSNDTLAWDVFIDGVAPAIVIQSPTASQPYNGSKIYINYSADDGTSDYSSGLDSCWYGVNGSILIGSNDPIYYTSNSSLGNTTLGSSCFNTSLYLSNGQYTMTIYANDTVGNIGYTAVTFNINDTASPIINISSLSPQGTIPYATSEVLFLTTDENATCRYGASNVSYDSMIGTFSDNLTQHIKTVSVAEGENDFYIRCRDMSNNTNVDSTLLNFVVESHPSPPSGGSTGGGGGTGGSGGWGGSGGYDTTGDYVAQTIDSMDAGVTNVDVNKRGIPVSRVTFNTSRNLTDVMITINKTTTPEKNYTEDVVLAYLLLEQKNLPMDALISLDIYFSVNRTWLKENNLSKEEIILLEYFRPNDTWNPLHTEYVNEDEDNIYYISRSTGPGLYAISTNHTHDLGTPIIQEPETPKANKTANASVTSYVNSGAGSGNSKLSAVIKDIVNAVKTQKELIWIVLALIITFAVVVTSMLLVKRHAVKSASQYDVVKQYEEGLISGTKEEFKQSEKVLTKKVPAVPEDIEAELSKMVDKKFSEAKSQDKKTIESNKKNKTLKK